jgi:hypothetical protein
MAKEKKIFEYRSDILSRPPCVEKVCQLREFPHQSIDMSAVHCADLMYSKLDPLAVSKVDESNPTLPFSHDLRLWSQGPIVL